jgi:hypothetical protein
MSKEALATAWAAARAMMMDEAIGYALEQE